MTLTSIVIEYTLITVFNISKSAYANAIGMDVGNFRRSCRAAMRGDEHGEIVAKSIGFCLRADIPLDPVFDHFKKSSDDGIRSKPICAFSYLISRARHKLTVLKDIAGTDANIKLLYQIAADQLHSYETILCGNNEDNVHTCRFFHEMGQRLDLDERTIRTCPCKVLEDMLDSLCRAIQQGR